MENIPMPAEEPPSLYSPLPAEVKILSYYLDPKVRGEPVRCLSKYMREMKRDDLYGTHPGDIFSTHAHEEWECQLFFFTTPPPPPNKENRNKLCNIGAWKVVKSLYPIPIEDPRLGNQVVGFWRVYHCRDNSNSDQRPLYWWRLTEYTTLRTPKVPSLDYVFCIIDQIEYDYVDREVLLTCAAAAA